MVIASPSALLAQCVDDYIGWFSAWHRLAFLEPHKPAERLIEVAAPESFALWQSSVGIALTEHQPVIERLAVLQEQLQTLVKLVLIKTPDGALPDGKDYDSVTAKYMELMQLLRRCERAFSAAASELDPLTGMRTRLTLQADLERELSRCARTGRVFCAAIMDIDHFKKINDTYGHDAGDRVLTSVANHISRGLRGHDDAYRLGGEEFLLCLKETDIVGGTHVLERLRAGLAAKPVASVDGKDIQVTASFGICVSASSMKADGLLKRADEALYKAKNEGRNRVVVAE
jgi:diguanylate cyclase (GGDEF)-like protein